MNTYINTYIHKYININIYIYIYLLCEDSEGGREPARGTEAHGLNRYLYLSIYIYLFIYLHIYPSIYIYLYLSIYLSIYMFKCIHVHIYLLSEDSEGGGESARGTEAHGLTQDIYQYLSIYIYLPTCLSIYVCLSMSVYLCLSILIYLSIYLCMSICTYMHTCWVKTAKEAGNPHEGQRHMSVTTMFETIY